MRVYTDGSCSGGRGGWAWAVESSDLFAVGNQEKTTNQRMEIHAALEACLTLDGPFTIVSDSKYVVDCFNASWWRSWKAKGWKNANNKPVANRDLWEPFIHLALDKKVSFEWVKGHSGHPMNDLVDKLAVEAGKNPLPMLRRESPGATVTLPTQLTLPSEELTSGRIASGGTVLFTY
jgi:ribonuclease HI